MSAPGIVLVLALLFCGPVAAAERTITRDDLIEKLSGFWIGQLVGNYLGFPFELVYVEEPIPVLVDRYYTPLDSGDLRLNRNDHRELVEWGVVEIRRHGSHRGVMDKRKVSPDRLTHVRYSLVSLPAHPALLPLVAERPAPPVVAVGRVDVGAGVGWAPRAYIRW